MIRRVIILLLIVGCEEPVAPDTAAPTIVITFPVNESTLTASTTIKVDVTDNSDISSVKFLIDGTEAYADSTAPYEYEWDVCVLGTGSHTVLVKAEDGAGNQGQSDLLTFTINANYDCESVCGGDKLLDNCEVCDADTSNDCLQDECGEWGGDGVDADSDSICDDVDDCIVQDGVSQECGCNTGIVSGKCDCDGNVEDCFGECGGSAEYSDCMIGTYTMTTYIMYENLDCSGSGVDQLSNFPEGFRFDMIINSDNTGMLVIYYEGDQTIQSFGWTLNDDQFTYTYYDDFNNEHSFTYTYSNNYLIMYEVFDDHCEWVIFTKQ